MIKNMSKYFSVLFITLLTFGVFILTENSITGPVKLQLTMVSILTLIIYGFRLKRKGSELSSNRNFIYLLVTANLFVVGATGWFFSPFFFSLYLMIILLSFLFSPAVSFSFVGALIALFSMDIGKVDLTYDYLVVLSLLTAIPLSLYLRKEYLKLREGKKDILILENHKKSESKVEQVLANKINNLAVELRQPINDVKLMAYRLDKDTKNRDRMITASEEALRVIGKFEDEATGKIPLITPASFSQPKNP